MFEWTGVNMQILRDLWGKHSSSYIAGVIGNPSRNSVLGKAHRLGLMEKKQKRLWTQPRVHSSATPRRTPFRKPRVQRFREVLPMPSETMEAKAGDTAAAVEMGVGLPEGALRTLVVGDTDGKEPSKHKCTLMALTSETCRWPLWGEVVSDQYCGAKPIVGSSYCPVHSKKAWRR